MNPMKLFRHLARLAFSAFQLGLILLIFAIIGALLAGCGGGDPDPEEPKTGCDAITIESAGFASFISSDPVQNQILQSFVYDLIYACKLRALR